MNCKFDYFEPLANLSKEIRKFKNVSAQNLSVLPEKWKWPETVFKKCKVLLVCSTHSHTEFHTPSLAKFGLELLSSQKLQFNTKINPVLKFWKISFDF